jgi:hypothetical protein
LNEEAPKYKSLCLHQLAWFYEVSDDRIIANDGFGMKDFDFLGTCMK